ncbi:hypothetical protein [Lactiplantibacillus herbarum]|uniref:hypothetical protein n=1 Tax=Lactiplantibacillus herbarum TaxID=1670446 RepID=UPI000AAF21DB|nr:hypothetical protein [Lactiplantibacillus herbarum]
MKFTIIPLKNSGQSSYVKNFSSWSAVEQYLMRKTECDQRVLKTNEPTNLKSTKD